jgi:hypothetical protein
MIRATLSSLKLSFRLVLKPRITFKTGSKIELVQELKLFFAGFRSSSQLKLLIRTKFKNPCILKLCVKPVGLKRV